MCCFTWPFLRREGFRKDRPGSSLQTSPFSCRASDTRRTGHCVLHSDILRQCLRGISKLFVMLQPCHCKPWTYLNDELLRTAPRNGSEDRIQEWPRKEHIVSHKARQPRRQYR